MKYYLKSIIAFSLLPQILLVKYLANRPDWIEDYYSNGIYPFISTLLRTLLGWVSFSVGDILYTALLVIGLRYLICNRKKIRFHLFSFIRDIVLVLAVAYFTFHLLWGFNYYRLPINNRLAIDITYTKPELISLTEILIAKTNAIHFKITSDTTKAVQVPYSKKEILQLSEIGYQKLSDDYPEWHYAPPSIKKSLFSTALSYMGYGGYLNPFTNEAQVNALIPKFRDPFISCHEIGHQIGYSAENETNFIGYLATVKNDDLYFQYSAYTYMIAYCLNDVKANNSETFDKLYVQLNTGILKNYQEVTDFWLAHENPLEPIFKAIFNTFLKANNQKDGIESYSKVVALLVNYHKKYPIKL